MIYRKNSDYDQFACLAGECPDTCCKGWKIEIDEESLRKYASWETPFGIRVQNSIDWAEACYQQYQGTCVLLDEEGYCELQKEQGEEALCDTCRLYPRHVEEYENRREYSLSLSCPEAARRLLEREEPMKFQETADQEEEEFEEFDQEAMDFLLSGRELLIGILQNRDISMEKRIDTILEMSVLLQKKSEKGEYENPEELWKRTERLSERTEETEECPNERYEYDRKRAEYGIFYEMNCLREEWEELVENCFREFFSGQEQRYAEAYRRFFGEMDRKKRWERMEEQILVTLIDLYLCGAVYDGEVYGKTALAVFWTRWVQEFLLYLFWKKKEKFSILEDASRIVYYMARELEHSDWNLELLEKWAKKNIIMQKN